MFDLGRKSAAPMEWTGASPQRYFWLNEGGKESGAQKTMGEEWVGDRWCGIVNIGGEALRVDQVRMGRREESKRVVRIQSCLLA